MTLKYCHCSVANESVHKVESTSDLSTYNMFIAFLKTISIQHLHGSLWKLFLWKAKAFREVNEFIYLPCKHLQRCQCQSVRMFLLINKCTLWVLIPEGVNHLHKMNPKVVFSVNQ